MSAGLQQAVSHKGYTNLDVLKAALGTAVLALALACVYGPVDYYSPLVYLNAVLAGLMGWAIGRCGKVMLRRFRIDGKGAATVVAVVGAAAGLWFSWLTYLWVLLDRDFAVFSVFANPSELWSIMEYLSENPAWSLSTRSGKAMTDSPSLMYWGIWLVEGIVFLYAAAKECREFVTTNKLCPQCGQWLRATGDEAVFEVAGDMSPYLANIAAGDLRFLEKLPRPQGGETASDEWLTATCYACGTCEGLNAHVTLTHSLVKPDKKKKPQTTTTTLANMVEIPQDLETALFRQPPETPAAAAPAPATPAADLAQESKQEQTEPPAA